MKITLCNVFPLRCNVYPMLFGKSIACIAIHVGIIKVIQILRPYGAGSVVRETIFILSTSEMSYGVD